MSINILGGNEKGKTIKKAPSLKSDAPNEILTPTTKKVVLNFGDSILEMNVDIESMVGTFNLKINNDVYSLTGSFEK